MTCTGTLTNHSNRLQPWLQQWLEAEADLGGQQRTAVDLDIHAVPDMALTTVVSDSRQAVPGCAFIALAGRTVNGLDYAEQAVAAGAVVVLTSRRAALQRASAYAVQSAAADAEAAGCQALSDRLGQALGVPVVVIDALEQHVGTLAACFYQHPSQQVPVVGVTGTNGKSSCAHFLAQCWSLCDHGPAGFIGTLGVGRPNEPVAAEHTTPDAVRLQQQLHDLHQDGLRLITLEVSSHALDQQRVSGVRFAAAVFTNLTRDHLDYHGTMAAYGAAKARLFREHPCALAVINSDDAFGRDLATDLQRAPVAGQQVLRYALNDRAADVRGRVLSLDRKGLHLQLETPWGSDTVHVAVLGRFQAANLLAVVAVLGGLGCDFSRICSALNRLQPVPGRMQPVMEWQENGHVPLVLVDYAHTPDALEQALLTAREITTGELWCVFGCGGDRDRGKRPQMGAVAARLADRLVVTSDNPRHEDPHAIIRDIVAGLPAGIPVRQCVDRAEGITLAVHDAAAADVVVVAGKGHEPYQDIAGRRQPFDDVVCARRALECAA